MMATVGRRQALLEAIGRYWAEHGFGPTYREIGGKSSISEHLARAAAAGQVHYEEGVSRSAHLTALGYESIGMVPVSRCGSRCSQITP